MKSRGVGQVLVLLILVAVMSFVLGYVVMIRFIL